MAGTSSRPAPAVDPEADVERPGRTGRGWLGPVAVVGVIAAFLVSPTFRAGQLSVQGWSDQTLFLQALRDLQAVGSGAFVQLESVGPGYLAAGRAVSQILGLEAGQALIVLARLSFVVVLVGVLLGARETGRHFSWPVLAALSAAVLLTPWRYYSDVPWTHPQAAALLMVAVVALRHDGRTRWHAAALGAALWLLLQTRNFEFQALLAAVVVLAVAALLHRAVRRDLSALRTTAAGLGRGAPAFLAGAGVSWLGVGVLAGAWKPFAQYASSSSGGSLSLNLGDAPTKLVQLFVDPCYRTYCGTVGDYAPQGLLPDGLGEYWRQPLLLQLPFTLASIVVLAGAVTLLALQRRLPPYDVLVAVLTAGALVLGYTANPIAGGAHLKYGFVRDFTAPAALLLYAAGRAVVVLLRTRRQDGVRSSTSHPLALAVVAALGVFALVPGQVLPRVGPVLSDFGLSSDSSCLQDRTAGCTLDLVGQDVSGAEVDLRDRVIMASICDGLPGPIFVSDGVLPDEVAEADRSCRAAGGESEINYKPVELGVFQTPDGGAPELSKGF